MSKNSLPTPVCALRVALAVHPTRTESHPRGSIARSGSSLHRIGSRSGPNRLAAGATENLRKSLGARGSRIAATCEEWERAEPRLNEGVN
jgi:hypothetical protein